jgi:hypothetical protein
LRHLQNEKQIQLNKENELTSLVESVEKKLIRDLSDEQRKLSLMLPYEKITKIINYANYKASIKYNNIDNVLNFKLFQSAFNDFKSFLRELIIDYQDLRSAHEQSKRTILKLTKQRDEESEALKNYCIKQKEKESIRLSNDHYIPQSISNANIEVNNLNLALKNKEREIRELHESMADWKRDTLNNVTQNFDAELNREIDLRLDYNFKLQTNKQQEEINRITTEIEKMSKEFRNSSTCDQNQQNRRMINYLQTRLNDSRDENLILRGKLRSNLKTKPSINSDDTTINNPSRLPIETPSESSEDFPFEMNSNDDNNLDSLRDFKDSLRIEVNIINNDDIVFTPSAIDTSESNSNSNNDDVHLENKNELLKKKLNELKKLQTELNDIK